MLFLFQLAYSVLWVSLYGKTSAQLQAAAADSPQFTACPAGTNLIRPASVSSSGPTQQSLSTFESKYISTRGTTVLPAAWASYFNTVSSYSRAHGLSSQIPAYVSQILTSHAPSVFPRLGVAASGGGYRAAIFGAGVLDALDSRNATSNMAGLGGLLQSASYITGLSGGSWLILSLSQADFPPLPELVFGPSQPGSKPFDGWNAQFDITQAGGTNASLTAAYISTIIQEIVGKAKTGFPVTFADVWARALSRHFVTGTRGDDISTFFATNVTHGAGVTLSGLTGLSTFKSHTQPFPIVLADVLSSNGNKSNIFNETGIFVPLSNTIYEFNPFEFGSFDPMVAAFTPTQFLGSPNNSICVTNFDQLSFVESASSNLFNEFNTSAEALQNSPIGPIIALLNASIPQSPAVELDAASVPNPFFGVPGTQGFVNLDAEEKFLKLVDGGENGEIDPLQPLLVQAREVDTIFAIDAPADNADNFAEGFSIIQRASLFPSVYSFPPVPTTVSEFAARNLTKRPTFFGCNSSTSLHSLHTPLIIYIANGAPPLGQEPLTNTATMQTTYEPEQIRGMLNQVFDIATQGIPHVNQRTGTLEKDAEWPVCLACAVVDRARARLGVKRSGICASCLDRYCWS
ncbi:unnamed protein product [Somion occarium]|uniref:Lysophospholipase n=1 Tax=Somion occarium TaxID=3059160 RepID=A0ABP1E9J0_9APHY